MADTIGYIKERDFVIFDTVGFCATTRKQFVKDAFSLPTEPVSATIFLVGIPGIISAKENAKIADMYNEGTMALIDGMPIVKMARRVGFEAERCAGPDIMGPMFEEAVSQGKTHYFYGGKNKEVLVRLRENLERDYQGIRIIGMHSPPFRPLTDEEDKALCQEINQLQPDVLWVGIGAPKQEMWMADHRDKIHKSIMIGVGAGFDFLAGTLDKAPPWMEKCCLEWFYRLCKEPKRLWRRYIIGGFKYLLYSLISGPKLRVKNSEKQFGTDLMATRRRK